MWLQTEVRSLSATITAGVQREASSVAERKQLAAAVTQLQQKLQLRTKALDTERTSRQVCL